ncbi:MAG: Band 7 protein [Gammaproteobacteria bacterium CG_4_9_14_3_um_filter_38_9]|nr:MAG: Band 7 protein [Gammaproteobacteria bacterium CG_4_9_14_3_um_filter_38_9]
MSEFKLTRFKLTTVVSGIMTVAVLASSFYTIDAGDRGVILRNGKVVGTADPGLSFKLPIIDSVKKISVQTHAQVYEKVLVYSRDQQTANLQVSVNYRLLPDEVEKIYTEFGSSEGLISRTLDRQVPEEVKNVFGRFNAVTAIQERERLGQEIMVAIKNAAASQMMTIESVQVENIDFSNVYEQSIEQRMLAEVEVQKVQQNAQREKVQAEIKVIQAKADADAVRLQGDAEASAINARGKALRDNPGLVDLVAAEKWDGKLPTTMVPGSSVPFINVAK